MGDMMDKKAGEIEVAYMIFFHLFHTFNKLNVWNNREKIM